MNQVKSTTTFGGRMAVRISGLLMVLLVLLAGCAHQQPVVYPANGSRHAPYGAKQAAKVCMARAESYGLDYNGNAVARRTAEGGVVGGAGGAVAGAIYGDWERGALAGLASGATAGLLQGLFAADEPAPVFRRFVARCLAERGYDLIGWR